MLVVLAGPGGVGKDTVARLLCDQDLRFVVSRSWTTRPPRPGESRDDYTFVDRAAFEDRIASDGFLEWAEYHGNLYGTPTPAADDPRHLVLVIETQGARRIREMDPDSIVIVLEPPSEQVQAQRLRGRGDDEASVARRVQSAADELAEGRALADAIVVNDDLTQAVAQVRRILENRLSGENERSHG